MEGIDIVAISEMACLPSQIKKCGGLLFYFNMYHCYRHMCSEVASMYHLEYFCPSPIAFKQSVFLLRVSIAYVGHIVALVLNSVSWPVKSTL